MKNRKFCLEMLLVASLAYVQKWFVVCINYVKNSLGENFSTNIHEKGGWWIQANKSVKYHSMYTVKSTVLLYFWVARPYDPTEMNTTLPMSVQLFLWTWGECVCLCMHAWCVHIFLSVSLSVYYCFVSIYCFSFSKLLLWCSIQGSEQGRSRAAAA